MSRIQSVDFFRTAAVIAVIVIHTVPFANESAPIGTVFDLATLLNQVARFAVPFFFVISGFFWTSKRADDNPRAAPSANMAKRILIMFSAWSGIYLLPTSILAALQYGPLTVVQWNWENALRDPFTLILEGTKMNLWFLPALLSCLVISAMLLAWNMKRSLVALALIIYAIGLAGKAYADTPIGFHVDFNFRNGPFFGLIFFVSGYLLHRSGPKRSWFAWGVYSTISGYCLQFLELSLLNRYWGTNMAHDYLIGTYFVGIGVALMALSNAKFLRIPMISGAALFVPGIYAVHIIFIELLDPIEQMLSGAALWEITHVAAVFLLSLAASHAMSRNRFTRTMVV